MYMMYDGKDKKGFSLPELMAVLVILVLIALLAINVVKGTLQKADDTIDADTEKQVINAAEKWAIENSDKFDDVEGKKIQVGLDVVFIVDASGGMNNALTTAPYFNKASATIDSINSALKILKQNNDNRVGFVFFSGKTASGDYGYGSLPLWNKTTSIIYKSQKLENISSINELAKTLNSNGTLKEATISINGQAKLPISFGGGTYTQLAIQEAANILMNDNSKSKKGRIPVIILVTDGEPSVGTGDKELNQNSYLTIQDANTGSGNTTWCLSTTVWNDGYNYATSWYKNKIYASCEMITGYDKSKATDRSVIMSMNVMNAAMFAKNNLSSTYNSNSFFYTIGIGLTSDYARFLLNPTDATYDNLRTSRKQITTTNKNDLDNYWDKLWHVDISEELYQYIDTNYNGKYLNYPTKAFVDENMTASELEGAFLEIADQITNATKVTEVCVTLEDLYKEGYLSKKDIKLANGSKVSDYVIMSINEATNQYTFNVAKTEKQKADCEKYLVNKSK